MSHIFLIDAFPDECDMYAEYLRVKGFQVSTFAFPESAFNSATTARPDLIVTRIRQEVGHISGIELTARLKSEAATRDIPVVIITTSILAGDRADAEVAGSDAYLLLPTTPDDLVKQLREVLRARALRNVSPRPVRADQRPKGRKNEIA